MGVRSPADVAGPRDVATSELMFPDMDATADDGCVLYSVAVILSLSSGTGTPCAVDEAVSATNIVDEPGVGIESVSGGDGEGVDIDGGAKYDRLRLELCVVLEGRTWTVSTKLDSKLTTVVVNSEAVFAGI